MQNPADYTNATFPTAQAVRDFINLGNPTVDVRLLLLNEDLTAKNVLPDGTNDITRYVESWSIENNTTQDVPRSIDLLFNGAVDDYVDYTVDRMAVGIVYYDNPIDRNVILGPIWKGKFGFQIPNKQHFDNGESQVTIKGFDDVWDFTQIDFLADYVGPRGFNVTELAAIIMRMDYKTPSEGGRQPGGDGSHVEYGYSTNGLPLTDVPGGGFDTETGQTILVSPIYNVINYNTIFDQVRVDIATYAPISPFTGLAMWPAYHTELGGYWWECPQLNLWYHSASGAWYQPSVDVTPTIIMDPFKGIPLPAGRVYEHIDPSLLPDGDYLGHPLGNTKTPLSTWPYDYDRSGPYFTTSDTGGVVSNGTEGPSFQVIPMTDTFAKKYNTLDVLPGDYMGAAGVSAPDPSAPTTNKVTPRPYNAALAMGPSTGDISGWDFDATTWILSLSLNGPATYEKNVLLGNFTIEADVYYRPVGTGILGTLVGHLNVADLGDIYGTVATCAATVPAVTIPSANELFFQIKLTVVDDFLTNKTVFLNYAQIAWSHPPRVPNGVTFVNPGNPGLPIDTSLSGTGIPWPDIFDPGLCPSGCETPGRNLPASRINFPDFGDVLPATTTGTRKMKHLAFLNQLFNSAGLTNLYEDESGVFFTKKKPFYTDDGIPAIEWTFSNEDPSTDGQIVSLTQSLADGTSIWNVTLVVSEPNGNAGGFVAKRVVDDALSLVGRDHMLRPITHIEQNDQLLSQEAVDNAADDLKQVGASNIESIDIVIPANPFFTTYDTINVKWLDQTTGEYVVDGSDFPYLVTDWKLIGKSQGQSIGLMQVTAQRAIRFI